MLNKYRCYRVAGCRSVPTNAIALALMALLFGACGNEEPEATISARDNITTQEVAYETNRVTDQIVTVRSEVIEVVGTSAFTIDDEEFMGGEEILVINATGKPFDIPVNDTKLQVTGEVRQFDMTEVAREFNLDLPPEAYLEYEDKPVIIGRSFALSPTVGEITRKPYEFYNQMVAVEADIEEVFSPNMFTLDENQLIGGNALAVINPVAPQNIDKDQKVVVTGVLRPFVVSEIENDYNLTWDLDLQRQVETEYRNKPVLISQYVFLIPE